MIDCSRSFFSLNFLKKYIDLLALHKFNKFHWHFVDDQGWRIEIKKYPELTSVSAWRDDNTTEFGRYGGFYTQKEAAELIQYAAARHITVIPEIEMPGHSEAVLAAFPALSCEGKTDGVPRRWGIFNNVFCAGKEATYDFLQDILTEIIDLFPSPYIHIGGDECPKDHWENCPDCQKRMKDNNLDTEDELQNYLVNRMARFVKDKGRTIIGWDEILDEDLEKNALIMSWQGFDAGTFAAKKRRNVIMCPTTKACYFDHKNYASDEEPGRLGVCTVKDTYTFEPVPAELSDSESQYILGSQANIWTEDIRFSKILEYLAFPRISALSEVLWTKKTNKNWIDFQHRLKTHKKRLDWLGINYYRGELE